MDREEIGKEGGREGGIRSKSRIGNQFTNKVVRWLICYPISQTSDI